MTLQELVADLNKHLAFFPEDRNLPVHLVDRNQSWLGEASVVTSGPLSKFVDGADDDMPKVVVIQA